ncbi:hypothetical protein GCK32_008485 [Trichostrongylus colubriformis]|uniref:Uncharacterized protein n=1 Tax=Trichostrongylus colubriformis TaxID=6319 RepID=A0AAN8ESS9_TRICO
MTVLLLIYNRWRTKKSLGTGTRLSTRYQLAENIRVLKILLPVIVCDLSMTICDILSRVMFEIADETNCSKQVFGAFYVIFKFLSFLSQLCIPLSVVLSHPVFRKIRKIGSALHIRSRNDHRIVIRSVLGTAINGGQTADNYFTSLQKRWEKD